jgi:hypothetical protein
MDRTLLGICLGLATGLIGVGTMISGYAVQGVIALVLAALVVLGFVASRARNPRSDSSGGGSFYGGAAGSAGVYGDGSNDGGNGGSDGGGDGGSSGGGGGGGFDGGGGGVG